jgi:nucleoside-diphosphate-sugar epimerase
VELLLGLGFTTCRLAKRLLARGATVYGLGRETQRFRALEAIGLRVRPFESPDIPKHATVFHSIPPLTGTDREWLHTFIQRLEPRRVIYISATSVYGEQIDVDETAEPRPSGDKSVARYEEEQWLLQGPWRSLIVRPAAIYGPGRGVHEKIREGKLPRGAGSGVVSRIHVDDLAAVLEAGALSDLSGAWPLADDHPCSSEEIAGFSARLLRLNVANPPLTTFPVAGRRVDGRKIRELLGVELLYPTHESGILASLSCSNSPFTSL